MYSHISEYASNHITAQPFAGIPSPTFFLALGNKTSDLTLKLIEPSVATSIFERYNARFAVYEALPHALDACTCKLVSL